jgi:hypothetical protein
MREYTESARRKNQDGVETEKKRKSRSRQNGVGTKPETNEGSAGPAERISKMRSEPALRPSPGLAAGGARHRGGRAFQAYPHAAQLDFQNPGATNWNATRPCGHRPYARQKSVRLQNVRQRCGRPRRRAALLPVQPDTGRPPKLGLCASAAQERQFGWPWPFPIHRESVSSLLLFACSEVRCGRQAPKLN